MKILTLILIALTLLGCGDNPQNISKSVKEDFYVKEKGKNCHNLNLYSNLITKKNIQSLFECLKLDRTYPILYNKIKQSEENKFSVFNNILNQTYLKNLDTRNKLFGTIIQKTKKDSSRSLSHLMKSFLEKKENISSLVNITKSLRDNRVNVSSNFLFSYLKFMADLGADTEQGRKAFAKDFQDPKLKQKFSTFLQTFLENILLGEKEKRSFIIFLSDENWMADFLANLSVDSFEEIIFFIVKNASFLDGVNTYRKGIYEDKFDCSKQSQSYVVDHRVELNWQLENLYSLELDDFNKEMMNLVTRFRLYSEICYEKEFNPIISKLLQSFTKFINIEGGFSLLKKFAELSLNEELDNELIINFFMSKSFSELNDLLKDLSGKDNFIKGVYSLLKSLDASDFKNISNVLKSLQENPLFVNSLKRIWTEDLKENDRKVLVDYVADMFITPKDIYPAFDFLNTIVENLPSESKLLIELLLNSDIELDEINNYLMSDDEAHKELLSFFEEDALFSILSLIQKNNQIDQRDSDDINIELPFSLRNKAVPDACVTKVLEISAEISFEKYISSYPVECLGQTRKSENFAIKIIRWSKSMNKQFFKMFELNIASEYGLLNTDFMHFLHQMVHVTTKYVQSAGDFSKETVNSVKDFLFKDKKIKIVEQFFKWVLDYDQRESVISPLIDVTKSINPKDFDESIKYGFNLLSEISSLEARYKCRYLISCTISVNKLKRTVKKNGLNFNLDVAKEIIKEIKSNKFLFEDYIELIRFLGKKNKSLGVRANSLENILRAVDFKNSYYAIFFISKLANASSYKETVAQLKKDFNLATNLSSTLKFMGIFPSNIKKRFSVVNENLKILDDFEALIPGKEYSYGDVLIELMKTLNNLSPKKTQSISKISIPKANKVYGHLGHYLTAFSTTGYLAELVNFAAVNLEDRVKSTISFEDIGYIIGKLYLDISIDKISLNELALNKKITKAVLEVPQNILVTGLSYADVINKFVIDMPKKKIEIEDYRILFKILSDKDVDYESLRKTLINIHEVDPNYLPKLIQYSLIESKGETKLESGLREMFIESNESLINFFKDILAHFKIN